MLIFIIAMSSIGCYKPPEYESRIACSSGFDTGWKDYASVSEYGIISFRNKYSDEWGEYKINHGESCKKERREKK